MLTLVEYTLLLYRALLPTPVWYRFFLNKEYGSLFSSLTTGLYLTFKLTSVVEKVWFPEDIIYCFWLAHVTSIISLNVQSQTFKRLWWFGFLSWTLFWFPFRYNLSLLLWRHYHGRISIMGLMPHWNRYIRGFSNFLELIQLEHWSWQIHAVASLLWVLFSVKLLRVCSALTW